MLQRKKLVVMVAIAVGLIVYMVLRLRSPLVHDKRVPGQQGAQKDLDNAQLRGERDARKDLASGHYILLGYGLPPPGSPEFAQCMRGYGIEIRNIGGDVFAKGRDLATGYELSYYQSYNATSSAAIKQKFGPDVFDRCRETARKQFALTRCLTPRVHSTLSPLPRRPLEEGGVPCPKTLGKELRLDQRKSPAVWVAPGR